MLGSSISSTLIIGGFHLRSFMADGSDARTLKSWGGGTYVDGGI